MTSCLDSLNANSWNGAECTPTAANGTQLGPNFGFYKSHSDLFHDAVDCWNQCSPCLQQGIDANLAVTTHCDYTVPILGPGIKAHCGMGFDYGT